MSPPLSGPLQAGCTSSLQEIVNSLGQAMEAEMAAHFENWPCACPPRLHRHCTQFAPVPRLSARSRHPADRRAPPRPLMRWAGKEAAPCLRGDQLGPRIESAEFLELFYTQQALHAGPQSSRFCSRVLAKMPCSDTPAAPRLVAGTSPAPSLLRQIQPLPPPPESLTTAGPRCPRLPRARPRPFQVCRQKQTLRAATALAQRG